MLLLFLLSTHCSHFNSLSLCHLAFHLHVIVSPYFTSILSPGLSYLFQPICFISRASSFSHTNSSHFLSFAYSNFPLSVMATSHRLPVLTLSPRYVVACSLPHHCTSTFLLCCYPHIVHLYLPCHRDIWSLSVSPLIAHPLFYSAVTLTSSTCTYPVTEICGRLQSPPIITLPLFYSAVTLTSSTCAYTVTEICGRLQSPPHHCTSTFLLCFTLTSSTCAYLVTEIFGRLQSPPISTLPLFYSAVTRIFYFYLLHEKSSDFRIILFTPVHSERFHSCAL